MRRITGLMLICVMLGACGSPPGVIFEPLEKPLRWPTPPDEARIGYVGQLATDRDLKPGRSAGKRLSHALFGRDDPVGMTSPIAVCVDGRRRVFVADPGAAVVHVFDLETREYQRWTPPDDRDAFESPVALAVTPSGRLLVVDSQVGTVFMFEPDGSFFGTIGDNRLTRPVGVATDSAEQRIYVADAGAHEVVVFAADGEIEARVGGRGSRPGLFNYPTYIDLDADGRLFVSDSLNFRVQVFDTQYEPVMSIGGQGDLPGYFSQPKGLALDGAGRLYVVDAHFEAVQVFDTQGRLLMSFGQEGSGPGEFWLPAGVFVGPEGRIWVADSYNQRVQVFELLETEQTP